MVRLSALSPIAEVQGTTAEDAPGGRRDPGPRGTTAFPWKGPPFACVLPADSTSLAATPYSTFFRLSQALLPLTAARLILASCLFGEFQVGREADLRATGTAPRGDESREKKKEDIFFIFFQRPGEEEKRESSRNRSAMWTI